MKKNIFSVILLGLFLLLTLTTNVFAAEGLGSVRVISAGTSDIDKNGSKTITVKYTAGNLQWYQKDVNIGRTVDGYWIGIRIDAPSDRSENAQYKRGGVTVKFDQVKDGSDYVNAWINVTQENLKKIKDNGEPYIILQYDFDWNGDGNFNDQKLIVEVDPDKVILDEVPSTHVKVTVNSIVGSKTFTVKKGESLNSYLSKDEKANLDVLTKAPAGKKYIGLFRGDKAFSLNDIINEDMVLTAKFENALDETPKTGVNESMYSGVIALISLIGLVGFRKRA